ncbi:MAG: spore coat protein CotH [Oscillibacter sp.]|nr:spore coat protein CotH [Oscillibacter sp.]
MATHKYIDRICIAAAIFSLLITALFLNGKAFGVQSASKAMGYETRLFDASRVHTIQIVMDDWDSFLETCEDEEYAVCSVVIDNEAYKNVGIRAKGNTSLSMVSALDSDRYSFKIEFDQYESGKTYYGLDKLCLNNIIQDNTYMKDYLVYQMMAANGVNAPLCSYVYITVNGEDWGLYLAVEGVEDGFLQRNYGSQYGSLYKPDSTGFGGGRGNGRDFNMDDLGFEDAGFEDFRSGGGQPPGFGHFSEHSPDTEDTGQEPGRTFPGGQEETPFGGGPGEGGGRPDDMAGGMGSSDVKLQYTGDDTENYSNIFNNAKTDIAAADQTRLIQALKALSEDGAEAVDVDQVLRYFAVHNYVCNGDSYTGALVHNYYLYEEDGQLSMIPWDYNLAFGGFQTNDAASTVNDPIDTPLSVTGSGDRPMIDWIFSSEESAQLYHQYFAAFLETVDDLALIDAAYALIAPYVEKDPTKFCTYAEFEAGVKALKTFCQLRRESVLGQLAGTIPSTSEGQSADHAALVDASGLTLSDMGTMSPGGFGGDFGGGRGGQAPAGMSGEPPEEAPREPGNVSMTPEGGGMPSAMSFSDGSGTPSNTLNRTTYILLGISMLVLLGGLLVVSRCKRWGR